MNLSRKTAVALAALSLAGCSKEEPDPGPASGVLKAPIELSRACWIWNRREPLTDVEAEHLRAAGITRLYWHSAEIVRVSNIWQFPQENPVFAPPVPDGFERVPVLRLASPESASTRGSFPGLGEFIAAYLEHDPSSSLHIDFDCPDSLLARYAELLGYVRSIAKPEHLAITALASWANKPGFDLLQQQVDEIAVLFYDLRPDPPSDIAAGSAIPMVDLETIRSTMPHWRQFCSKPWFAGFPNFSRLSIFGDTGLLSSDLHDWNRDALVFHPDLEIVRQSPGDGITWLATQASATITESVSLEPAQHLVLRQPASESLRESARLASEAGASGIVWFPLPEPDAGTGFTASHLTALLEDSKSPAALSLTVSDNPSTGVLTLTNEGPYDLAPRLAGNEIHADRGWQFEIDGGKENAFTEAATGSFVQMLGHTAPDAPDPITASVQTAQRLTFRFAALPAGASQETGPILRQPGVRLRWRIDRGEWQDVPTAP
jgi:hypothetical protein